MNENLIPPPKFLIRMCILLNSILLCYSRSDGGFAYPESEEEHPRLENGLLEIIFRHFLFSCYLIFRTDEVFANFSDNESYNELKIVRIKKIFFEICVKHHFASPVKCMKKSFK